MKRFNITVNGKAYDVAVEEVGAGSAPAAAPVQAAAPSAAPAPAAAPAGGTLVKSPMPGDILDVKVNAGDTVSEGQVLMVLEAMKMENDVNAPCAGKILSINTTKSSAVETGAVLAVIG